MSTNNRYSKKLTVHFRVTYLVGMQRPGAGFILFPLKTSQARNAYYDALMAIVRRHKRQWSVLKGMSAPDSPRRPFCLRMLNGQVRTFRSMNQHVSIDPCAGTWNWELDGTVYDLAPRALLAHQVICRGGFPTPTPPMVIPAVRSPILAHRKLAVGHRFEVTDLPA